MPSKNRIYKGWRTSESVHKSVRKYQSFCSYYWGFYSKGAVQVFSGKKCLKFAENPLEKPDLRVLGLSVTTCSYGVLL